VGGTVRRRLHRGRHRRGGTDGHGAASRAASCPRPVRRGGHVLGSRRRRLRRDRNGTGPAATSPAAAERVRNKAVSRDALASASVAQPRYARVSDATSVGEAAQLVGFPAIYKPCGGAGSAGVQYVATAADLPAARAVADTKLTSDNDQFFAYYPEQFILEQFVSGPEVSVEGVVARGRVHCVGVTAKSLTPGTFLESRHVFPAALDQADTVLVTQLATEAVQATGIDNCGFHVEVMLSPQGPVVIEVNGRLGGDFIASHLVPLASGTDLMAASLKVAVGEEPDLQPTGRGAACVRFLVADRDGVVVSVSGVQAATASPGIVDLGQNKVPGDRVRLPPDSYFDARLAYAISSAADGDTAARLADQAIEAMSYDIA